MSMWHHFTEAADWLAGDAAPAFGKQFSVLLAKWPKFYIPEAGELSGGRMYDDMKSMMRLPYPGIVTLRETRFHDSSGVPDAPSRGLVMTMFFDIHDVEMAGERIIDPSDFQIPSWGALTLVRSANNGWRAFPPCIFIIDGAGPGFVIRLSRTADLDRLLSTGFSSEQCCEDLQDEPSALLETCMLLHCTNVEAVAVPAPKFLNRKRQSRGKRALYEYHVLRVDGEVWDSSASTTGHGVGVRSHFRRGHFRRIDDARMTWVRATMVKGSVPGFVEKDYDIRPRMPV